MYIHTYTELTGTRIVLVEKEKLWTDTKNVLKALLQEAFLFFKYST